MSETTPARIAFGPFVLDAAAGCVTREGGGTVALPPKAYAVLCHLVARPGRLVTKDELLDAVWGHRHVTESVLKTVMSVLRQALGDEARTPRWIETAARRGYRFVGVADAAAPAAGPAERPGNLPPRGAGLVGRERELARLAPRAGSPGLVTIVGPGGVGKTRLALHAADAARGQWPEGAWLVELAAVDDVAALRGAVAQTLGLTAAAVRSDAALAAALSSLHALVVIDNAEHLAGPLAAILQHLNDGASGPCLLVTSQTPLAIEGEEVFALAPLALPSRKEARDDTDHASLSAAEQLFVQRVVRRLPDFSLVDRHRAALREICWRLDGLPLALELAAASVPLLGVQGLCDRLTSSDGSAGTARLDLPAAGWRTAATRQRSLRGAVAWSHALLSPAQQQLFRRLAVLRSSFSARVAERVGADGDALPAGQVLQALAALVDLSLVVVLPDGRMRLLEAPREFAQEQLDAAGERAAVQARLVQAMLDVCARWEVEHFELGLHAVTLDTRPELDNLRAAMRIARDDPADGCDALVRLLGACFRVLVHDGLADEVREWADAAQARIGERSSAAARHGLALVRGYLAQFAHAYPMSDCVAGLEAAAQHHASNSDAPGENLAQYLLWMLAHSGTRGIDAAAALARMRALDAAHALPFAARRRLRVVQQLILRDSGQTEAYLRSCRDDLLQLRAADARSEAVGAMHALLLGLLDAGQAQEALQVGLEAVAESRALGQHRAQPALLALTLMLQARHDDPARARASMLRDAGALRASGRFWMAGSALAWLASRDGRDEDAARLIGWSEAQEQSRGLPPGAAVRRMRADLRRRLGKTLGAERRDSLIGQGGGLDGDAAALACALPPPSFRSPAGVSS